MSNSEATSASPETNQPSSTTTTRRHDGIVRAALYAPAILLIGGLAALAAFPNLADYAAPLVAVSSAKPVYPFNGTGMSPGGGGCCGLSRPTGGSCSLAKLSGGCGSAAFSCCTLSDDVSAESNEPVSAELAANVTTASSTDAPADAFAAVNVTTEIAPAN